MAAKRSAVTVGAHPFAPGAKVGFHLAAEVGVERAAGREPFGRAAKTATVRKDGSLSATGLKPGLYCAVAEVGGQYRYVTFAVK